jgi:rRNA-processing protein FCF1
MEIDSIIIDGNNACYSSSSDFIGLSAVRTLAQHLSKRFKVTVVFDASIRKLLKASTQDIQKNLGREISTYVAPSKNAADEYILKLAEGCDRSYIITNDRYSEWHDYDAVREARAINFLISSDKIIVNDLDVSIPF